jgi:hypothetical protein
VKRKENPLILVKYSKRGQGSRGRFPATATMMIEFKIAIVIIRGIFANGPTSALKSILNKYIRYVRITYYSFYLCMGLD